MLKYLEKGAGLCYLCTPKTDERRKGRGKKRVKDWVLKKRLKNIWRFKIKSRPLQPETESEGIISEENFVK